MNVKFWRVLFPVFFVMLISTSLFAQKPETMNRHEIPAKYKWNFSDIYSDWDAWEEGLVSLEKKMDEIVKLKGTLGKSPKNLLNALKLQDELGILSYRVYRYPQLMRDTDTRNQEISAHLQKVSLLFSGFGTATAWINPEILQIPWETMEKWIKDKSYDPYRFGMEDLYRQQKHVLDEDKEKLISFFSQFNGTPNSIYTELSTSDIDFPTVKLSDGSEVKVTNGNYGMILATNRNQEDRKLVFENHYQVYKKQENTYAAVYNAICQRDWASAQARDYNSTLEAALDGNNIPVEVYKNLIKTVKDNTEPLKKYNRLRKKILKLDKYYSYDGSVPITDFDKKYSYETALEWILESVEPLGKAYQEKMKQAIKGGWLDVYENEGKRSGAYSADVYGVHPYMLMNYNETLGDVFTLAHELGHTMHTTLSNSNQPFAIHSYTIFVAEVASTFNEQLLLEYLLEKTDNPKERIALLQQAIRNITGTLYFQTLLADFELQVHELVEKGKPITATVLNNIMKELNNTYYGDTVEENDLLNTVWARIGHFYRAPYYVYQYATCFVSSAKLYNEVIKGSPLTKRKTRGKYLNLLKSGGSDYPMNQLLDSGVDLTQSETIMNVVKHFDRLVELLEKEVNNL